MKKPPSPRTPKHGRGPFLRPATSPKKAQQQLCLDPSQAVSQAGASSGAAESPKRSREPISHKAGRASQQAVPPIFQSPRKRPPSGGAGDGGGPELTRCGISDCQSCLTCPLILTMRMSGALALPSVSATCCFTA